MRKLIITLIVIIGLLVGADFALAAAADYKVGKLLRSKLAVTETPKVTVHGFPFITQALAGDYRDTSVRAAGISVGDSLTDLQVAAELHDTRVPFSDLVSGSVRTVTVDRLTGKVRITAGDIARLASNSSLGELLHPSNVTVGEASSKQVLGTSTPPLAWRQGKETGLSLAGTLDIAGEQTRITGYALVGFSGSTITISTKKITVNNSEISAALPAAIQHQLSKLFTFTIDSTSLPLPFKVRATSVAVQSGALVVAGSASNIVVHFGG
ncbi:MAG: LmeA family phospholipid-binding protein [Sciscionella sp.]